MKTQIAGIFLAIVIGSVCSFAQDTRPESVALTNAAQTLSAMPFNSGRGLTVRAIVASAVWPERAAGMIVVEVPGSSEKYAFSTAGVPAMAKQGLSRFTLKPGDEIIVTGVRANGDLKIGPGFAAARADLIMRGDGTRLFDRAQLPIK